MTIEVVIDRSAKIVGRQIRDLILYLRIEPSRGRLKFLVEKILLHPRVDAE
jgi:hypothetical protein